MAGTNTGGDVKAGREGWGAVGLLGLFVGLTAGLAGATPAYAHASLVSSSPRDGASLASAPRRVVLRFDEAVVAPAYMVVTAPGGEEVQRGDAQVRDDVISQPLGRLSESGAYTVAFRVVSEDGHPVTGQLSFRLTSGAPVPPSQPVTRPRSAATAPAAAHSHAGGPAGHWIEMLPLLGVLVAWLVVYLRSRRRQRGA